MKSTSVRICVGIMVALLLLQAIYSQSTREQTKFSAEEPAVHTPIKVPREVFEFLKQDKMVQDVLENENISLDDLPAKWFSAAAIHLSNTPASDLVVVAEGPLVGANVTTFWVFRQTPQTYELVLTASAHDLWIKKTQTNGYRDIELISMTCCQLSTVQVRFDGSKYRKDRSKTEPIR